MCKYLFIIVSCILSVTSNAQITPTAEVQFYVDANNDCAYNPGEQLIHNLGFSYQYVTNQSTVQTYQWGTNWPYCGTASLNLFNAQASPPINTLTPNQTSGISPYLSCVTLTNIPYNTTFYVPFTHTPGISAGANLNSVIIGWGPSAGTYTNLTMNSSTLGICSNIGADSLSIYLNMWNLFTCSPAGYMTTRTFSFKVDGVVIDTFTLTGTNSYTYAFSQISNAWIEEFYNPGQSWYGLYPKIPQNLMTPGTHTFQLESSMIYNHPQSKFDFSFVYNSVPCSNITGKFFNDCNQNCTFDSGDSYGIGNYATGLVYNSSSNYSLSFQPNFSDGKFSIYLPSSQAYSLTQFPSTLGSGAFTACSTGTIPIPQASGTYSFLFGYKSNLANATDPLVSLSRQNSTSSIISPLVGITFGVHLTNNWWNICNGTPINPGKVKVTLPKFINYLNSVSGPSPTIANGPTLDTLIWSVSNFSAISNWWNSPYATFSAAVNATAIPNTAFTISAFISPSMDMNLSNNTFNWIRFIDGPFDPNGKWSEVVGLLPNGNIPYGTSQFVYKIGFQNIGNAPAINVKTVDTMDVNFDLSSLKVIQSSFPVSTQIDHQSREVIFHFNSIYLPGVNTDEPGSHGFVKYSIDLKPGVSPNTILRNRAQNYFDFNEPVATNQTSNLLVVGIPVNQQGFIDQNIKAMPCPFNDELRVLSEKEFNRITVCNVLGEIVFDEQMYNSEVVLNLSELASGLYLIRVNYGSISSSSVKVIKY